MQHCIEQLILSALTPGTYVATLAAVTDDGRTASAGHVKFWVLLPARP